MPLPAAEHAAVLRETKRRRNAGAKDYRRLTRWAQDWCAHFEAEAWAHDSLGGTVYSVRVPGFHEAVSVSLARAVGRAHQTLCWWCDGPATHGPTGADLTAHRRRLAAWREPRRGV